MFNMLIDEHNVTVTCSKNVRSLMKYNNGRTLSPKPPLDSFGFHVQ